MVIKETLYQYYSEHYLLCIFLRTVLDRFSNKADDILLYHMINFVRSRQINLKCSLQCSIRTEIEVVNGLSRTIASLKFLVDGPHRRRNFAQHWHVPDRSQLHFLSGWNTRTVQYKMSSAPTTNPNEPGYIGDFNGEPIVIPQISEILKTRLHYMGNNTVMALN